MVERERTYAAANANANAATAMPFTAMPFTATPAEHHAGSTPLSALPVAQAHVAPLPTAAREPGSVETLYEEWSTGRWDAGPRP